MSPGGRAQDSARLSNQGEVGSASWDGCWAMQNAVTMLANSQAALSSVLTPWTSDSQLYC